jgi:hypothetical protein
MLRAKDILNSMIPGLLGTLRFQLSETHAFLCSTALDNFYDMNNNQRLAICL